jgi:GT2 family glycosyltransferase
MSVVVPVKDRVPQLRRLLESLAPAIERCDEPCEVIVVDDSTPPAAAAHQNTCSRHGARYVRGPRHVGAKRNLGAAFAAYDLLMFTDSDCQVPEDLLARYSARLRAAPDDVAAVTGPVEVAEGSGPMYRVMNRSYLLLGDLRRPANFERVSWGAGANTAVRRTVFESVGGFPEDSPMPIGGEDLHLGLTLTDAGHVILTDPQGRVVHDRTVAESWREVVYRLTTYARSEQWLCARHPRRRRITLNVVSLLAVSGVAAVAAARHTRGRSLPAALLPAAAVVASRVPARLGGDRSPLAVADALACTLIELSFDASAFATALRMRRPDLLFTGFRPPDEVSYQVTPSPPAREAR